MKALTVVAALESGKYTPHTPIDASPGWIRVDRKTLKDPVNYGQIDVTKVLTKSSQIGTTRIALSLEHQRIWEVFQRFGLGASTDTGFPGESYGLLPNRRRWSDIERANFAFGYGLSVTPLQLARAYGVFAAGGRMYPVTLVKREQPATATKVVSPVVAQQLVEMLMTVTGPEGTAKRAQIPGYTVAGKTGTVHKVGTRGYEEDRYRSIFAGFAPATAPRIVTVVVVDDPSKGRYFGGQVAAPVFARVVGGALRMLNVAPDANSPAAVAQSKPAAKKGPV
jgi:cell division protein FtsI (penicillin-binding protein 3)